MTRNDSVVPPPVGFVILCSDLKPKNLWLSLNYLQIYESASIVAVIPPTKDAILLKEYNDLCITHRSRDGSMATMINSGFKHCKSKWIMILRSGDKLRTNLFQRFGHLFQNEMDVFCPLSHACLDMADSPINGMVINQTAFTKIGNFKNYESDELSRLAWLLNAKEKGCTIKGFVGLCIQ